MPLRSLPLVLAVLAVWLLAAHHAVFELAGLMDARTEAVGAEHQRWHVLEDDLRAQDESPNLKPAGHDRAVAELPLAGAAPAAAPRRTAGPTRPFPPAVIPGPWLRERRAVPPPGAP